MIDTHCRALKGPHKSSVVTQMVKNLPAMWETRVWFLGWEDPPEKGMATHSSVLAWRIPWTEEPGELQSIESQRIGHDWVTNTHTHTHTHTHTYLQDLIMCSIFQTHLITETLSTKHLTGLDLWLMFFGRRVVFLRLKGDVQDPE